MPHFRVMAVRDIVIFLKEQSKAENVDAFLSTLGRRAFDWLPRQYGFTTGGPPRHNTYAIPVLISAPFYR